MDKQHVSAVLNEIGLLLELVGENPFKARAYYQASRAIDALEDDLDALARDGRLDEVPGLGPALKAKVAALIATGRLQYYDDLRAQVPPGLLAMLRVPGLGPRKVQTLYRTLGLANLEDLEEACRGHRLQALPGFGVRTELKILAGLAWLAEGRGQHLWLEANNDAEILRRALSSMTEVAQAAVAGSLRRCKEVVKDIDLVAATEAPIRVAEAFSRLPMVDAVKEKGETKVAVTLKSGLNADLRLVTPASYPAALVHLTGSREHNTALRTFAKERGLKLNEYGLFRGDEPVPCEAEEAIYRALGLAYIAPELREELGELEAAAAGALPVLVGTADIRGALHVHTSASDGTATLAQMAAAAAGLGWEYLGTGDHSQSAAYAGGLRLEALDRQWEEVAAHNRAGLRPYLLAGIECEIKPDGSLDYPDETLARFDYVVASVHSSFHQDRETMTARIVKAMGNPYVTILGHPTGRLLLEREGYPLDLEAVFAAAVRHDVALEINASPYRLDLDWRWCKKAKDMGIRFWINPDAHSTAELNNIPLGINVARKGWLGPEQVGNTLDLAAVQLEWRRNKPGSR